MRWFGISQSTDLHHPQTKVKTFTSLKAALKWKNAPGNGAFTYAGAVGADVPASQQNFHHTFRSVYEVVTSVELSKRAATKAWNARRARDRWASSCYDHSVEDELVSMIRRNGTEIQT